MSLMELLCYYIKKIDNADYSQEYELDTLIETITRTCLDKNEVIDIVLTYYSSYDTDYTSDLEKLKAKLIYKVAVLHDTKEKELREYEKAKEERELEKLRLQSLAPQSNIKVENINNNNSNSAVNITITLDQTIENINNIPDAILSEKQREELDDLLSLVDSANKSGDNHKTWSKIGKVLKYITDKGIEVGTAVLPYIGEISKALGNQ